LGLPRRLFLERSIALSQAILDELRALKQVIEDTTGLASRWSGNVLVLDSEAIEMMSGKRALAEKRWNCDIVVNGALAGSPLRWRTFIHELLHSVSVGMNPGDYLRFRGWEEGTVEILQRRLRPQIMGRLDIVVEEEVFHTVESLWVYNDYIEALERMRAALQEDDMAFYMTLLHTPLAMRMHYACHLSSDPAYRRLAALACGKLR
jgi:hypothetical protein